MAEPIYANLKKGGGLPPTRFQVFFRRVPYVVVVLITIVAVWVVVAWWNEDDSMADLDALSYGALTDLAQPAAFRRAYLKANGGLELLNIIQSVRMFGHMESAGVSRPFFSMKKRPDQMLLTFDFETHDLTFAVDGDVVWQRTRAPGQEEQIQVLEGEQADAFLVMREFFGPMMQLFFLEKGELHQIEIAEWAGEPCLSVRFSGEGPGVEMEAFVDPKTMNPMVRFERYADGRVRKTVYDDYRSLRGMQEPFIVETYMDDELQSRIVIEQGDSNLGVVSLMFEVPQLWKKGQLGDASIQ
jgi:hypothetical protein